MKKVKVGEIVRVYFERGAHRHEAASILMRVTGVEVGRAKVEPLVPLLPQVAVPSFVTALDFTPASASDLRSIGRRVAA